MGVHADVNTLGRVTVHIASKDRHSELALLLQSLRMQSFQGFDVLICDDGSGSPVASCDFIAKLVQRMKLEGHVVQVFRLDKSFGCCYARNFLIDNDKLGNKWTCRLDDDVTLTSEYLEHLLLGTTCGYDLVTGVVLQMEQPEMVREIKRVEPVICKHEFNDKGELVVRNDDLWMRYDQCNIVQCHQFRTNCLYLSKLHEEGIRYPTNLSSVAFREELWFSVQAILKGHKIGAYTAAICHHFKTPSGGNRRKDYADCVKLDEETTNKWLKEMWTKHGDFFK